jgi:signal transduction histidine kinase
MLRLTGGVGFRLLLLILLAMAPGLGLAVFTDYKQHQSAIAQAQVDALRLATTAANRAEIGLKAAHHLLAGLAVQPALNRADFADCEVLLGALLSHFPDYAQLALVERDGTLICSAARPGHALAADNAVLRGAPAAGYSVFSEHETDEANGDMYVAMVVPLPDQAGEAGVALVAVIEPAAFHVWADPASLPVSSTLGLLDRQGTVLAHYPAMPIVGRPQPEATVGRAVLAEPDGTTFEARDPNGNLQLHAMAPVTGIPTGSLYVELSVPTSVAYAEANKALEDRLVWQGFVTLLAVGVAWLVAEHFLRRPLRVLLAETEQLAAGVNRVGAKEAAPAPPSRVQEFQQLAKNCRQLADAVALRSRDCQGAYASLRREEQARARLMQRMITAHEDERMRIARELHDETSQSLTALMVGMDTARIAIGETAPRAAEHLANVKLIAQNLLDNVHRLIGDLRPSLLDDLGLVPAIAWYGEKRLSPLRISLHLHEENLDGRLPASMETGLFRIVQEALTNVIRHAQATTVTVHLARRGETLSLRITDDGTGFDPAQHLGDPHGAGFGLRGMQERVSLMEGEFQVHTALGCGTMISVQVPLWPEGTADAQNPGAAG